MAIELRLAHSYPRVYYKRSLVDYRSPYDDPFEYRSILDITVPDELYTTLALIPDFARMGHPRDHLPTQELVACGQADMLALIERAAEAYDPRYWFIPHLDGVPIGAVFAQLYPGELDLGCTFHIAVFKAFRGNGFGKIIHAHGLETTSRLGAVRSIGSTQPQNFAMQHVFLANGFHYSGYRLIEEFDNATGRALE